MSYREPPLGTQDPHREIPFSHQRIGDPKTPEQQSLQNHGGETNPHWWEGGKEKETNVSLPLQQHNSNNQLPDTPSASRRLRCQLSDQQMFGKWPQPHYSFQQGRIQTLSLVGCGIVKNTSHLRAKLVERFLASPAHAPVQILACESHLCHSVILGHQGS